MAAWIKQFARHVVKYGEKGANWYAMWDEPGGRRRCKSCGPGRKGRRLAQKKADQINTQLVLNQYDAQRPTRAAWGDFSKRYIDTVLAGLEATTSRESQNSLRHFARILKLEGKPMAALTSEEVSKFTAARRKEPGKKPKSIVSPATVNKELRQIKAALRVAADWGYLAAVPKIKFEREPERLVTYITPEDFALIYDACRSAKFPTECKCGPAAWWEALLVFAQMTGWRIGEILALKWADVDLEAGRAVTRHSDNKGKRDELVCLHPVIIDHIRGIRSFHPNVFPWEHHRRTLDVQFADIQVAAGIDLACVDTGKHRGAAFEEGDAHECTEACHRYSFHDERRAFATMNATNLTPEALQALMRHRHHSTTLRYINMARQVAPAVANLFVPKLGNGAQAAIPG